MYLQKHLFPVTFYLSPVRECTFGRMSYLQPMDTRQYLYCLKPKAEYAEKAGVIKGVTVIGKLDIVWKTNLGERGRLQTSQLQRMVLDLVSGCTIYFLIILFLTRLIFVVFLSPCVPQAPGYGDIRLSLEMIPDTVNLEEPFDIICKIANCRWNSSVRQERFDRRHNPMWPTTVCAVVKEQWTWCWRCATPGRFTGAAFQGVSSGSSAPAPRSLCPSPSSRRSRVCRYH